MGIRSNIKQNLYRAWLTIAPLVVCALLLTACSLIDEDIKEEIPLASQAPVKTQFTLSFSSLKGQTTRMSEDIVQGQDKPVFRGLQSITLFSFEEEPTKETAPTQLISLSVDDAKPSPSSTTQFYADVDVPEGTKYFVFYGEAKANGTDPHENGVIVPTGLDAVNPPSSISFALKSIIDQYDSDDRANQLAACLTAVATFLDDPGDLYDDLYDDLYNGLIKNKAGSSASVEALINQLYNSIKEDDKTGYVSAISSYVDVSDGVISLKSALAGYPGNIGLPDGAAYMEWDNDNSQFMVNSSSNISQGSFAGAALGQYVFPPSLYYWIQSPIRTSGWHSIDEYKKWQEAREKGYVLNGDMDFDTSWKHFLDMNDYVPDSEVGEQTGSIAIDKEVHYAVSCLNLTIKAGSNTLKDSQGRQVHFTSDAFPITGILVGDQYNVNYNFEQITTPTPSAYNIVYDNQMPQGLLLSTTQSQVNSTLLLESSPMILPEGKTYSQLTDEEKNTVKSQSAVNIAVEFMNNSGFSFYGYTSDEENPTPRIIPHGTKFYLVGCLQLDDEKVEIQDRIFKQGTITQVNFTVNEFKNAYNVVPDLRNPRIQIGLSADLYWQRGVKLEPIQF